MSHPRLTIGSIEIIPLTDAAGVLGSMADAFPGVPAEAWTPYQQRFPEAFGPNNEWATRFTAHLIRTPERTILVDTGIGPGPNEEIGGLEGTLLQQLADLSIAPDDIDLVFHTHLDFDHVSWNLTDGRPTFPKARYVVHQTAWDAYQAFAAKYDMEYMNRSVTPLKVLGVLDLLTQDTPLTPGVTAIETSGHSPGHMSVLVEADGHKALIVGDVLQHPVQVTEPDWAGESDMDPAQATATRRAVLAQAKADNLTLVAGHLPGAGIGTVVDEFRAKFLAAAVNQS